MTADSQGSSSGEHPGGSVAIGINSETTDESTPITASPAGSINKCCSRFGTACGMMLSGIWLLIGFLVTVLLFLVPFAMVIIGTLYFNDCFIQPMIPVFNIVGGSVILFIYAFYLLKQIKFVSNFIDDISYLEFWIISPLVLFLLGWLIAGAFWVYSVKEQVCNYTLFQFTNYLLEMCFISVCIILISITRGFCSSDTNS